MTLLTDIGNTNIVIAIHDGVSFRETFRVCTDQRKTSDEYLVYFESLLHRAGIEDLSIGKAVLSSVVPNLTLSIRKVIWTMFGIDPILVSNDLCTGLDRESIPAELGADLLSDLAWAHHQHPEGTVVVVDFGTALTLSAVDREGKVLGVSIAPGLITAVNALFGSTAQLPQVELAVPDTVLGRDTQGSIRSGIMMGYAGLVTSLIERIEKERGEHVTVMATGGLSKTISPLIGRIDERDKYHTLRGLELISRMN